MRSCAIALLILVWHLPIRAQDDLVYRPLTDKKGQQINAAILEVSTDRRLVSIQREDGEVFALTINLLSLDDQQFIKDWLDERPSEITAVMPDFRLDLEVSRQSVATETAQRGSLDLEEEISAYEVVIRNLSRETLEGASLRYVIVWDNRLQFITASDGTPSYRYLDEEEDNRTQESGAQTIESVGFNREVIHMTAPFSLNSLILEDSEVYREDELYGIIARVEAADGTVLAEEKSSGSSIASLSWDEAIALGTPVEEDE